MSCSPISQPDMRRGLSQSADMVHTIFTSRHCQLRLLYKISLKLSRYIMSTCEITLFRLVSAHTNAAVASRSPADPNFTYAHDLMSNG